MKTTIDLPDEIFHKAKVLAAHRRSTLKDLVIRALVDYLRDSNESDVQQRRADLKKLLESMRATNISPIEPLKREDIYDR